MFVFVAVFYQGRDRVDDDAALWSRLQDYYRWDQVPRFDRDDVRGEELEFVEGVGVISAY